MDNSQYKDPTAQDPLVAGITSGVGANSEANNPLPPHENLNSTTFTPESLNNPGGIGNAALSSAFSPHPEGPHTASINQPGQLGDIVDLPMPALKNSIHQELNTQGEQNMTTDDSSIPAHFADGAINKDDVAYLNKKAEELDPESLIDFVNEARSVFLGKGGNSK